VATNQFCSIRLDLIATTPDDQGDTDVQRESIERTRPPIE
jgi:hypothetical protein